MPEHEEAVFAPELLGALRPRGEGSSERCFSRARSFGSKRFCSTPGGYGYVADTNIAIAMLAQRQPVTQRISGVPAGELKLSVLVVADFQSGRTHGVRCSAGRAS